MPGIDGKIFREKAEDHETGHDQRTHGGDRGSASAPDMNYIEVFNEKEGLCLWHFLIWQHGNSTRQKK